MNNRMKEGPTPAAKKRKGTIFSNEGVRCLFSLLAPTITSEALFVPSLDETDGRIECRGREIHRPNRCFLLGF
jgi:hypothetical protein